MFEKTFLFVGLMVALTGPVAALSPPVAHATAPLRLAEPSLLVATEPAPVDPTVHYICGTSMLEDEMIAEQLRVQAQSANSTGDAQLMSLPPIATTPIQ